MSHSADLPFVAAPRHLEPPKAGSGLDAISEIIPCWEGWLARNGSRVATAVAEPDGVGGGGRTYNPPQGLAALAPPKRGFTFSQFKWSDQLAIRSVAGYAADKNRRRAAYERSWSHVQSTISRS